MGDPAPGPFTAVVCTRDREDLALRTLQRLLDQDAPAFPIVVVDQSRDRASVLARRAQAEPRVVYVADTGTGISRARNLGAERSQTEWVAYLDDDCLPAGDWGRELSAAIASHPEAAMISGHVDDGGTTGAGALRASVSFVEAERVLAGARVRPAQLGLGVCFAVRRETLRGLGGFDCRLGPGSEAFPAAEDMDFNYRLLRSGAAAVVTPRVRAVHEQWRSAAEIRRLYRGYWLSGAAMAMKHVRQGDLTGGAWLWALAARDVAGMGWGALKRRSIERMRVCLNMLVGLVAGTIMGLGHRW